MRKILVVVDMQKDPIDGSLGTPEARGIVDNVVNVMEQYSAEDIFATRDTHPENYLETQEGQNLPVVHCVRGTPGWGLDPRVQWALRGAQIVDKPTFGSKELAERIARIAKSEDIEVTLVDLCTDICVISNALLIRPCLKNKFCTTLEYAVK